MADRPPLVTFERRSSDPQVLVVTNIWPCDPVPAPSSSPDNEPRGGPAYGIFVARQVDALERLGVPCDVLFVRGYVSAAAYPSAALRLALLGLRRRYRLVHAFGGEAALATAFVLRTPTIVSYLGSDVLLSRGLRRWAVRQAARRARATITMSRQMEAALPAGRRIHNRVLPLGIDPEFRPAERDEARRRLGWRLDERVVLFASHPARSLKRFSLAEAACDRARQRIPGLRLHVASGIAPNEMPTLMNAADCLVVTSSSEGSPNVVREAMRCNLPVVSTDVGDVRELLRDVEPAHVCGDSPAELADALVACLDPPRRSNGALKAAGFGADDVARRLVELYAGLGLIGEPVGMGSEAQVTGA